MKILLLIVIFIVAVNSRDMGTPPILKDPTIFQGLLKVCAKHGYPAHELINDIQFKECRYFLLPHLHVIKLLKSSTSIKFQKLSFFKA